MKDKMLYWTQGNDKVEGTNKLMDIKKNLEGIASPVSTHHNPYAQNKTYLKTLPSRVGTSP